MDYVKAGFHQATRRDATQLNGTVLLRRVVDSFTPTARLMKTGLSRPVADVFTPSDGKRRDAKELFR